MKNTFLIGQMDRQFDHMNFDINVYVYKYSNKKKVLLHDGIDFTKCL